jgi:hypothetical protein
MLSTLLLVINRHVVSMPHLLYVTIVRGRCHVPAHVRQDTLVRNVDPLETDVGDPARNGQWTIIGTEP